MDFVAALCDQIFILFAKDFKCAIANGLGEFLYVYSSYHSAVSLRMVL